MTVTARERDRIRWRCRRGMLELDLVLASFLDRRLAALDDAQADALNALLMRSDPELLDLLMGRTEGRNPAERALLELITDAHAHSLTPDPSPGGRGEIRGLNG